MNRPRVAVATSGGLDSTALLHCTVAQAHALGIEVVALHVHHGLMPEADSWLAQVRRQALRWGAAFEATRLQGGPDRGESVEAWAREGRYQALTAMAQAQGCGMVVLAHHRRDQAETWLLQALRGAGDAGLSSMPVQAHRNGLCWSRPWLDMGRGAIMAYARRHRLRWVQDPSNADLRFARSRLRASVWPALELAFPDSEVALALAARHAQYGAALAAEVAQDDLAAVTDDQGLKIPDWAALRPARQRNALRGWLIRSTGQLPPYSLVDRLLTELPGVRTGRWPVPGGELRLYRGRLVHGQGADPASAWAAEQELDLSRPGNVELAGWGGALRVTSCQEGGVPPGLLREAHLHMRRGGEQFQRAPKATARSLKKAFQNLDIPAWARGGPLVSTAQGQLLFVPGLGMDARSWAAPGEVQLRLEWLPAATA